MPAPTENPMPKSRYTHTTRSVEFRTTQTHETNVTERPESNARRLLLGERWEGPWEIVGVVAASKFDKNPSLGPRVIWKRTLVKTREVVFLTGEASDGAPPLSRYTDDEGVTHVVLTGHHRVAIESDTEWTLIWRNTTSGETFCGARWPFADGDSATAAELESIGFLIEPATTRSPEPRC